MAVPHRPMSADELAAMTPTERQESLAASVIFDPDSDERMTPELRELWNRSGERTLARARQLGL